MQVVSPSFDHIAAGDMRRIEYRFHASFHKEFNDATQFFTVGESIVQGPDFIKPVGSDVVQEWDKYDYVDYSHRILSMEWAREEEPVNSVVMATADIVLDNHDNYFSAENFILPKRPVRLFAGFNNELVQVFVGMTEGMPEVDEKNKTVRIHCIDFLSQLFNRPLDESVIYEDMTTDAILDDLLQRFGLSSLQYELDPGFNRIELVFFEKKSKFGEAARQLMVAEIGRFYMDEQGIIRFKNRQNYSNSPVWTFDRSNIKDYTLKDKSEITNVVEITSNVRKVQPLQPIAELSSPELILPGESKEVWLEFSDPVISANDPNYIENIDLGTDSSYNARIGTDPESAPYTDISLDSSSVFAKSMKMVFENVGTEKAYLTNLKLFGEPAVVDNPIYVRYQDDESVGKYDEQVLTIDNEFFSTKSDANSKAIMIVVDEKDFKKVSAIDVKGNPALQLGDMINVTAQMLTYVVAPGDTLSDIADAYGITLEDLIDMNPQFTDPDVIFPGDIVYFGFEQNTYHIVKLHGEVSENGFRQLIGIKQFTPTHYFTVGQSLVQGTDGIAP